MPANIPKVFNSPDKREVIIYNDPALGTGQGRKAKALAVISVDDKNEMLEAPNDALKSAEFLTHSSGVTNMSGPGSLVGTAGAPINYTIAPLAGEAMWVHGILIYIRDNGIQNNMFGGIAQLTNGCLFRLMSGTNVVSDFFSGIPFTATGDLSMHASESALGSTPGGTIDVYRATFNFRSMFGRPIRIRGDTTIIPRLEFSVRDNLTNVDMLRVKCFVHRIPMSAFNTA